jgi:hypothetical protein
VSNDAFLSAPIRVRPSRVVITRQDVGDVALTSTRTLIISTQLGWVVLEPFAAVAAEAFLVAGLVAVDFLVAVVGIVRS